MINNSELQSLLGSELPAGVAELPDAQQQALAELLRECRERQSRELEQTLEEALGYVPALMRGAVKRILFP